MQRLFDFSPPRPYSVTELNRKARQLLEGHFSRVQVEGEVSGPKSVGGHRYFTLKDATAQLAAVIFRRDAARLRFELEVGMQVVATGRLTVYPAYGRYQLVVERLEPVGAGALQLAFEQLKKKLEGEGLFASERKRPLPLLPRRVAVVTSATGAVLRDIVHVARRRFPRADILLVPTRVQGGDAAPDIAEKLHLLAAHAGSLGVDVIILARGGGSTEDLWAYNEEVVARAVATEPVPVVSAVGHETDFTIADFVADHRAPTPSAAAEIVFPVENELRSRLLQAMERARRALTRELSHHRQRLLTLVARLGDGQSRLREMRQGLTEQQLRMATHVRETIHRRRWSLGQTEARLAQVHPHVRLVALRHEVEQRRSRLVDLMRNDLERRRLALEGHAQRLHDLSPLAVLERGYAIALDEDGRVVREAGDLHPGDPLEVRLHRGSVDARVVHVREAHDPPSPADTGRRRP